MGSSFLQGHSLRLTRVVQAAQTVDDYQREMILNLLQGQNPFGDYSARSGEIVGILKAMKDEMDKDLNGAVSEEEAAQKSFEGMKAAKESEIAAASEAIEAKTVRSGELAVLVTTTADDVEDTTAEMNDTNAFLANLASQCAAKKKEWAERQQTRSEEVAAISEAIKVLNDDDALDLFKKTLSLEQMGGAMGFLQKKSTLSVALEARSMVSALLKKGGAHAAQLSLLEYSLSSKKGDFSKVLEQIDGMVAVLKKEQADDDSQKEFCEADLAKAEDEKSATESAIETSTAAISEMSAVLVSIADSVADFSSSALARSASQNSFCESSSACSFFRTATIPSICSSTFEKSPFFDERLYSRSESCAACAPPFLSRAETMLRASSATESVDFFCRKPIAPPICSSDRVFLKRSSASSSLSTLIASLIAATSSERVCWRSAHSFFFAAHWDARFARKAFVSFISAVVSSTSSAVVVTSTASSPLRTVFASMASEAAAISDSFAAFMPS